MNWKYKNEDTGTFKFDKKIVSCLGHLQISLKLLFLQQKETVVSEDLTNQINL